MVWELLVGQIVYVSRFVIFVVKFWARFDTFGIRVALRVGLLSVLLVENQLHHGVGSRCDWSKMVSILTIMALIQLIIKHVKLGVPVHQVIYFCQVTAFVLQTGGNIGIDIWLQLVCLGVIIQSICKLVLIWRLQRVPLIFLTLDVRIDLHDEIFHLLLHCLKIVVVIIILGLLIILVIHIPFKLIQISLIVFILTSLLFLLLQILLILMNLIILI